MSDIAIRVENLSKLYRIGVKQERYKTLRDTVTDIFTAPFCRLQAARWARRRSRNESPENGGMSVSLDSRLSTPPPSGL